MDRREALAMMREGGDHSYYTVEFANDVQRAFGMAERHQTIRANTSDPKGLFVDGVGRNAPVDGYASHDLAESVASHLGLHGAWEQMYGRGSRERAALDAIDKHLTELGE